MPGPPGPPLVHMKVYVSGMIHTSVQLLWDLIRDYGQAHTWFGTYRSVKTFTSLLPNQINCQVGALRFVIIGHSGFVDQLDALDDERLVMKYKLISHPQNTNPFPGAFLNFKANIQLKEVTRGAASFMQWTGEFDTEPQDCEIMRQAIEELFEAGFQELENLVAPPPPPMHPYHLASAAPMGVVGEGATMGHLQRGLEGMNLKPSEGLPAGFGPMSGTGFPPARSPRHGPSSILSEPAPSTQHSRERATQEPSSLASSPQAFEGAGHRPGSGGTTVMNQWTSGGSASTINLSTIPGRRSGGEEGETGHGRRNSRPRTSHQEGIPEGSPYMEAPALPAAFQTQVNQRQADILQQPDGYARYQQQQQHPHPRQGDLNVDLPQRDSLGSASDLAGDMQYHSGHSDPLLQEREEYKASLLAGQQFHNISHHVSDTSLQSAQLAHETASEPGDWGRGMQGREGHSGGNSQVSSPHVQMSETSKNHQEWVRLMQQRELDLRRREEQQLQREKERLLPSHGSGFGPGGPFGVASAKGGPFAAASRLPPRDSGQGVRHSASQQSLASLVSPGGSGQLGSGDERMGVPQRPRGATADYPGGEGGRNDPRTRWPSG